MVCGYGVGKSLIVVDIVLETHNQLEARRDEAAFGEQCQQVNMADQTPLERRS